MSRQPSPLVRSTPCPSIRKFYLLAAAAMLAVGFDAHAAPVLAFNPSSGAVNPNYDQTIGWQFNVVSPIAVTGLGWYAPPGHGLATSHPVGLWAPNGQLLVFATVPFGTSAPFDGQFRTVGIPTIVLPPGNGYIIAGQNFHGISDPNVYGVVQGINSRLQFDAAVFSLQPSGFTRPTDFFRTTGFYGPSFSTTPALGEELVVPEPSTLALACFLGIGGLGYIGYRRRARDMQPGIHGS